MERIPQIEKLKVIRLVCDVHNDTKVNFYTVEGKEIYHLNNPQPSPDHFNDVPVTKIYAELIGNNDINVDEKYYCLKGHNITKESSNLLKEKGYYKTIKLDSADKIVTNVKSLKNTIRIGYNYLPGTFGDILNIVDEVYKKFVNYHNNSTSKPSQHELQLAQDAINVIHSVLDPYANDKRRYIFDVSNLFPYIRTAHKSLVDIKRDVIPWTTTRATYCEVSDKFDFELIMGNPDKVIDQQVLLNKVSADKTTMDYEFYKQVDGMLRSSDQSNRLIANRLIISCDPTTSFAYLCILFYDHQGHFYMTKDDFRDANSKSFMTQLCNESSDISIQTGTPKFWSINGLYNTIKKHPTHTNQIDNILLDIIKIEIVNSISHHHKELINTVALKDSIVLA